HPPEYIYAAADRHDEVHDMMRAVRDTRFKYIRNYFPNQPYWGMNEYRHRMGIFQEILRLHAEEKLEGAASFWMKPTRPPEELYDITEDPHEVHNLADHPGYRAELQRMRGALDQWMDEIGDMGDIPEEQLRERFWPGGEQPNTQAPFFVVNAAEDRARTWRREGGQFSPPYTVQITS
ncbi:sulfatase, partial [Halalkalibaculum sp. DA384]